MDPMIPVTDPVIPVIPATVPVTVPVIPQITHLTQEMVDSPEVQSMVDQIKACAAEIQCSDFHGKGSIEDYIALLDASKLVEVKLPLQIDLKGIEDYGNAADKLSDLFDGFVQKIQVVQPIDTAFLQTILSALQKIVRLSNTFGKFKQSMVATHTLQLSDSVGKTKKILQEVTQEVECAMQYIQYFVSPSGSLPAAEIDRTVIRQVAIEDWGEQFEHNLLLHMNEDLQSIQSSNEVFRTQSGLLNAATYQLQNGYFN